MGRTASPLRGRLVTGAGCVSLLAAGLVIGLTVGRDDAGEIASRGTGSARRTSPSSSTSPPTATAPPGVATTAPVGTTTPRAVVTPATTAPTNTRPPVARPPVAPRPNTVAVPNLVGMELSAAVSMVDAAGLRIRWPSHCDDRVTTQSPAAGTVVARGTEVAVDLVPCIVPDLVGLRLEAAKVTVAAAGLRISWSAHCDDVVLGQSPAAGTRVDPGHEVVVQLSPPGTC
jgi:hypothetical protein